MTRRHEGEPSSGRDHSNQTDGVTVTSHVEVVGQVRICEPVDLDELRSAYSVLPLLQLRGEDEGFRRTRFDQVVDFFRLGLSGVRAFTATTPAAFGGLGGEQFEARRQKLLGSNLPCLETEKVWIPRFEPDSQKTEGRPAPSLGQNVNAGASKALIEGVEYLACAIGLIEHGYRSDGDILEGAEVYSSLRRCTEVRITDTNFLFFMVKLLS